MKAAISLEGVRKSLQGREILKGIDFEVHRGDIFGYLGPNGAGKTTTIRILLGLLGADSGRLEIAGLPSGSRKANLKLGFLLNPDGLYNDMTARENLAFYARIYGERSGGSRIDELLGRVGLAERGDDGVGSFSTGMRQRLGIARAMVHDPDILILDEPTAGIDPTGRMEVRKIILDTARKSGKTVLLSSHDLDEVQRICNRIALIDRGKIRIYGELEKLRSEMGGDSVLITTEKPPSRALIDEIIDRSDFGFEENRGNEIIFSPQADLSEILRFLSDREVRIAEARRKRTSLEEMYSALLEEVEG